MAKVSVRDPTNVGPTEDPDDGSWEEVQDVGWSVADEGRTATCTRVLLVSDTLVSPPDLGHHGEVSAHRDPLGTRFRD